VGHIVGSVGLDGMFLVVEFFQSLCLENLEVLMWQCLRFGFFENLILVFLVFEEAVVLVFGVSFF